MWSNVSVKLRVIIKRARCYQRSTVRDSALRPQTLWYVREMRGVGGYADGTRLAAARRTDTHGVEYCLKKSVARTGVVSQWSHNTGSVWLKVVSTASSMNYFG